MSGIYGDWESKLNPYGRLIGEGVGAWANSDTVNTAKEIIITNTLRLKHGCRLEVDNPSTETDLTVEVYDIINGADIFVGWYTIPKKQTRSNNKTVQKHAKTLPFVFCGTNTVKIVASNDTVIGAAGAFTATFSLREVM